MSSAPTQASSPRELKGFAACFTNFFEYETPKVVTIQNVPLGILRLILQLMVIGFVVVYQLWYARGYQEFAEVESSVTTKVKGFSRSVLTPEAKDRIPSEWHYMYERVWDEADYVVPPAENGAFFVMTNVVLTPNQTRGLCPEDVVEVRKAKCSSTNNTCEEGKIVDLLKGHGTQTGQCVPSTRDPKTMACEIQAWCPIEVDQLPMTEEEGALIPHVGRYTVFIKNSISFSRFGDKYQRKNLGREICTYKPEQPPSKLCPIFELGDIVRLAGGNITKLAIKGGVIGIGINWNCDLDWNFKRNCLPKYNFQVLDDYGWNFRYAFYHEENRRTLIKAFGLKFLLVVDGRASKFDLKNTVIVLVTGLGLLGLSTMFCDFVLLNYSPERKKVKEKKYETVQTTSKMLEATMRIISTTSDIGMGGDKKRRRSSAGVSRWRTTTKDATAFTNTTKKNGAKNEAKSTVVAVTEDGAYENHEVVAETEIDEPNKKQSFKAFDKDVEKGNCSFDVVPESEKLFQSEYEMEPPPPPSPPPLFETENHSDDSGSEFMTKPELESRSADESSLKHIDDEAEEGEEFEASSNNVQEAGGGKDDQNQTFGEEDLLDLNSEVNEKKVFENR